MQDGKDKNSKPKIQRQRGRELKVESRQASADKEGLSSKADGRQKTDVAAEKKQRGGKRSYGNGKNYSYSFESVSDADSADGSDTRARGAAADGTKRGGKTAARPQKPKNAPTAASSLLPGRLLRLRQSLF